MELDASGSGARRTLDVDDLRTNLATFPASAGAVGGPDGALPQRNRFHWLVSPRARSSGVAFALGHERSEGLEAIYWTRWSGGKQLSAFRARCGRRSCHGEPEGPHHVRSMAWEQCNEDRDRERVADLAITHAASWSIASSSASAQISRIDPRLGWETSVAADHRILKSRRSRCGPLGRRQAVSTNIARSWSSVNADMRRIAQRSIALKASALGGAGALSACDAAARRADADHLGERRLRTHEVMKAKQDETMEKRASGKEGAARRLAWSRGPGPGQSVSRGPARALRA